MAEQLLTVDERPGLDGIEERTVDVAGTEVVVQSFGAGPPLLVLHDELGFSGWLRWTRELGAERELLVPLQPGFGRTPRVEWVADYRDLAAFYQQLARRLELERVDVIGFSAGGYLAAELAAACPGAVGRLALVAPLGVRPRQGEIFDFLAATARTHLAATVTRTDAPEVNAIYGGEMTPEAFELFEAARAETSRLGWEPFMFSPSLPHRLEAVEAETLIVWGEADRVVPEDCARRYAECVPGARLETLPDVGHRPEIEATDAFVELVTAFLRSPAKDR